MLSTPRSNGEGHLVLGLNRMSGACGADLGTLDPDNADSYVQDCYYTLAVMDIRVEQSPLSPRPPGGPGEKCHGSLHGRLITPLPDFGGLAAIIAHDTILLYDVMNKSLSTIVGLVNNGITACYFESESLLLVPEYAYYTNEVIRVLRIDSETSISPVFEFPTSGYGQILTCNESVLSLGVIVGGETRNIDCYNLKRDGSLTWTIPSPADLDQQGFVSSLALDPVDGSRLIISANVRSHIAPIFDVRTLSEVGTLGVGETASSLQSLLWHLDHPHCCIYAGRSAILFFDLRKPSTPYRRVPSEGFGNCCAHIDSGRFASCSEYSLDDTGSQRLLQMKIWDFDTGKLLMEEKTDGECFSICFCPDDDGGWGRRGEREDEEERIRFALVVDEGRDREEDIILPALLVVSHGLELFVSKFWIT